LQKQTDTKPGNGRLLTVKKACEIYGLDPTLIYHWIRYKKFDLFKLDKKVLFLESDFLNFLEQHKVKKSEVLE
jgi:predicted DNA-binding transcriptional regulator AlpA